MATCKQRKLSLLIAIIMILAFWALPNQSVYAGTSLPAISSSRYVASYTRSSNGRVYAYKDASLSQKTGGYIECSTDECRIIEIRGNSVKVSYPVPGSRKTAWFNREEFTYRDLASYGAKKRFTSSKKVTTYKWKKKANTFGYIASGDVCYLIRGDSSSDWLQVIYPTGNTYKMAWVKGDDIRNVIWPPSSSANTSSNSNTSSPSNRKHVVTNSNKVSLSVPAYRQYDSKWSKVKIGTKTIGQIGCTTTCIAMKYSYQTGKRVTPDQMKKKLSYSNNDILWNSVTKLGYTITSPYRKRINQSIMKKIYEQLKKGKPVIVGGIPSANSSKQHWIVVTGYKGASTSSFKAADFTIIDPNNASRKTLSSFLNYKPYVYRMIY